MKLLALLSSGALASSSLASPTATQSFVPSEQAKLDPKSTDQPQLDIQARRVTFGKRQIIDPLFPLPTGALEWSPFLPPDIPVVPPEMAAKQGGIDHLETPKGSVSVAEPTANGQGMEDRKVPDLYPKIPHRPQPATGAVVASAAESTVTILPVPDEASASKA